jgi:hypothetical protein
VSDAVRYSIAIAAGSAALIVVIANRPEKRPGNLAPIQLITALGAWALLAINAVLVGVACAGGFVSLAIAPVATLVSAAIGFAYGGGHRKSAQSVPAPFAGAIAEIRTLLGGARRLGLNDLDAVLVGSGPRIGVAVPASGRVVVLVHESVISWIDRHRRSGAGAGTMASFIRFAVLHELGHILNGDHRTYRFARSVLIAHLWWLLSWIAVPLALASGNGTAAWTLMSATVFVTMFVAVQSLIARRFIAERERLADWRAIQSLSLEDASRLLRRSGIQRAGRPRPTELEKLMIDLKAEAGQGGGSSYFAAVVRLLWPEGDNIQRRAEALAGDRAGAPARPVRWAALTGMQCGVLATAVAMGVVLAAGSMPASAMFRMLMIVMAWVGGASGTYCMLRADADRITVDARMLTRHRFATALLFVLTFLAGVAATECLAYALRITAWISGAAFLAAAMTTTVVIACCALLADMLRDNLGGSAFRLSPREPWAFAVPLVGAMFLVIGPFNIALSERLGLGPFQRGAWVAVMLCSAGAFLLSTVMARSSSVAVRAAAPVAVLDPAPPVFGYRLFWREFFVDLTRCSVTRAGVTAAAFQTAALLPFVLAFAFAMSRLEQLTGFRSAFTVFFVLSLSFFSLVALVPDRQGKLQPRLLRLIDRHGLELFLALVQGARHADRSACERLQRALACWLPSDRAVMSFLLPGRRSVWMLPALLAFVRAARAAGALDVIERTRGQIEGVLREIVTEDAVAVAPGAPPSLFYSTLATALADEAGLAHRLPVQRMVDRVGSMLDEQLTRNTVNLISDVVIAARLLQRHQRRLPEAPAIRRFVERSTLMSKPMHQQSLVELCDLAELLGDVTEIERLAPVVRSRMWEILQLNPRKEVVALLDCYLAAVRLGEGNSPLAGAAAMIITEIAARTADELMTGELREV